MMVTYSYQHPGQWRASCDLCGTFIVTNSIAEAYRRGRAHDKVCGQ